MEKPDALLALAALSQETRLDIFRTLVKAGGDGVRAGDLARALELKPNTLSVNLSQLLAAGLVRKTRDGRAVRYRADMDGMQRLLGFLMQDCCGGNPALCKPVLDEIACAC